MNTTDKLRIWSKIYKYFEIVTLFIGLPLLFKLKLIPGHKSIPLLIVFLFCLGWLLLNKDFDRSKFGIRLFKGWKYLLIRSASVLLFVLIITWLAIPESFFYLPRKAFGLWVAIMILYPLWSAYPQELIYRTFFFERYKNIFPSTWLMVAVNGFLFGFLHIIFNNWIAVLGASIVGIVLAITYLKNQSLLAVALEHAIIGDIVFTIGLGQFFYVPDF